MLNLLCSLASGKLHCVAQQQVKNTERTLKKTEHYKDVFKKLLLIQVQRIQKILKGLKQYYEAYHEVEYQDEAIDIAVDLAERYMHGKYNPIERLMLLMLQVLEQNYTQRGNYKNKNRRSSFKITRIPLDMIDAKQNANYEKLEGNIKKNFWSRQCS